MKMSKIFIILFLFAFTRIVNSSLLSRVKSPLEYVANDDISMTLDELDDETYDNLMRDLPQLKHMINSGRPYYRRSKMDDEFDLDGEAYEDFGINDTNEFHAEENQLSENTQLSYATDNVTTRMPYTTQWESPVTSNSSDNDSRRFFWLTPYIGRRVAICYWCGLHVKGIPISPLCHDMFESYDGRARTLTRFYRGYCYYNYPRFPAHRKRVWYYHGSVYRWDRGLINEYYGYFHGGCFKRFLDVGQVYTQRGCRYWWPMMAWRIIGYYKRGSGKSFASHRFKMLEAILKRHKNKCIMSPHASLTPFSRGISLYVRYHVCVCNKKYCNRSERFLPAVVVVMMLFAVTMFVT